MSKPLIVGTKECPTELVNEVLCSPSGIKSIDNKWTDIAEHLSLLPHQIDGLKLKQQRQEETKSLIMELVDIWVNQAGNNALLDNLALAIIESGLSDLAGHLRNRVLSLSQSSFHTSDSPDTLSHPKWTLSEPMAESSNEDLPLSFKIREYAYQTSRPPIIVGTPECSIEDISTVLHSSRWSDMLSSEWTNIAFDLGLDLTQIGFWNQTIFELKSIIDKMLSSWVNLKGSPATVQNLLLVLRSNGMKDLARELESKLLILFFDGQEERIHPAHLVEVKVISELEEDSNDVYQNINKVMYFPNQVLGTGFMGSVVFQGKLNNQLPVAVKRINESSKIYIENEIELLKKSKLHENIGKLVGYEIRNGFYYLGLELCNANLKDWVEKTEKGMEVQGITDLEILSQSISGLMFIHEKEIAHRNLKPSKIMLSKQTPENISVKLFGFGLATTPLKDAYISIGPVGSPGWMAPEVFNSQENQKINGVNADIFSMGCLFYYAVTRGGHPFGDKDGAFQRQVNIQAGNIEKERSTPYDSYGMSNLIKLMINSNQTLRPPLSVVENHPVFWKAPKIFLFSCEVNALRQKQIIFVRKAFNQLEFLGKELIFKNNKKWTETVLAKIGIDFESKSYKYENTVTDLNRAFRDTYIHRNEVNNPEIIRHASHEDCIKLWLGMFPQFLPCMWIVFKKLYDNGVKELKEFYEDGTNPFWNTNERFKLINSNLEVTQTASGIEDDQEDDTLVARSEKSTSFEPESGVAVIVDKDGKYKTVHGSFIKKL